VVTWSGDGARDVAALAARIARAVDADIGGRLADGRSRIAREWSGLAAVQALVAVADQERAAAVCGDAMSEVGQALLRLAAALDEAASWRAAADRLAMEAGLDQGAEWAGTGLVREGVRDLLAAAAAADTDADAWCGGQLTALAERAVHPALLAGGRNMLYRSHIPSGPGADAALVPGAVARDLSRPIVTREVAARLELAAEVGSSRADVAARARSLLAGSVGPGGEERHEFALYDPAHGVIAEVAGDVSTARHIVVFVPGVGTSIDNWPRVSQEIAALYAALRAEPGGDQVAVVGWLGSDEPATVVAAVRQSYAKKAAPKLAEFVEHLGAAPGASLTLVGHSYGAVIAGLAVRSGGLRPSALVGVGAPGFGPKVHGVADLHRTPTYVLTDPKDPINEVQPVQGLIRNAAGLGVPVLGSYAVDRITGAAGIGHLGTDPIKLAGGRRLSTGDDDAARPRIAINGDVHTGYFAEGGLVDRQIAAVALGLPPEPYRGPKNR